MRKRKYLSSAPHPKNVVRAAGSVDTRTKTLPPANNRVRRVDDDVGDALRSVV